MSILKEELFKTPSIMALKISPDGASLAKIGADARGIPNLFIKDLSSSEEDQCTHFLSREIIQFFWSADSKKVLLLKQDQEGLFLYTIDVSSHKKKRYLPPGSLQLSQIIKVSPSKNLILLSVRATHPPFEDFYLFDLDTEEWSLLYANEKFAQVVVSDALEIVLKIEVQVDGGFEVVRADDSLFLTFDPAAAFNSEFVSYDEKNQEVYLLDARYTDTQELVKISLREGEREVLAPCGSADISDILWKGHVPQGYALYQEDKTWHGLFSDAAQELKEIAKAVGENFEIKSQDASGNLWVITNSIGEKGIFYWLYDRKKKSFQVQGSFPEEGSFSKTYSFTMCASDGARLVCYYTLPSEIDLGGRVKSPQPLVVIPHGGPFHSREKDDFNHYDQWLSSCGYVVLRVNFRMSCGFGKAFTAVEPSSKGQWGERAHKDIIEAVSMCIAKGIARKEHIAILGSSYGGYEALMALGLSSNLVCCAVAVAPPTDLISAMTGCPTFWSHPDKALSDRNLFFTKAAYIASIGEDPETEEGRMYLKGHSPLARVDEIKGPLFLIHGGKDSVVLEEESKELYIAMKKRGLAVKYLFFPDEGHRITRYPNRLMMFEEIERFLAAHLGGSYVPVAIERKQEASGVWIN